MSLSLSRRALWHLYRTPAAHLIKWARRTSMPSTIEQRRRLMPELPHTPATSKLASDLNAHGYALVTGVLEGPAMQALANAGQEKLDRAHSGEVAQAQKHKEFWTRLLDEDMEAGTLRTDNPFVAFALQPAVLAILAQAYGELPQLDYVLLTLSRDTGKALSYSQLWHRDHDDTRVIKLFVYLTDVGSQDDGPFTFIPGPLSDRFGYSVRSHMADTLIERRLGAGSHVKLMVAPRMSAFLVETSRCLHMGSRLATGHERLLYTATYISVPRLLPEPPPRFRLTGHESEVVKCVLSAR